MPGNAFVYGTLLADEVVSLLIKRVPDSKPARLPGYSRYRVRDQVFPAIVPSAASATVAGKVLLQLSDKEMEILDAYESEEYYRAKVQPLLEGGGSVEADVYVWQDSLRDMLRGDEWDYEEFREQHLTAYLTMSEEFMQEYWRQEPQGQQER